MNDIFTFYKAVDPIKGSWDGYGYFPIAESDFLAFVADAPSGASIHTPEVMKEFWRQYATQSHSSEFPEIELADALNRLQNQLQQKGRDENILYQATIVVVRKISGKFMYCCIGDSALQILRGGKLVRLSENEIWDGTLIAHAGLPSHDRQKTTDLRFLGSNGSFVHATEIKTLEMKDQDLLVLSTDGIEDLLSPNQLLSILTSTPENLRNEMERLFAPGRIKDDATMLLVPLRMPPVFEVEKEFGNLRQLLERIQKDQNALRKQLNEISPSLGKINKLESSLRQLSDDVQKSKRNISVQQTNNKMAALPWIVGILCLLIGTAVGAFLMRNGKTVQPNSQPPNLTSKSKAAPEGTTAIVPPEIPAEQKCTYVIQKGDTLEKIAAEQKISVSDLLKLNPQNTREKSLKVGQQIAICKEETP